MEKNTRNNWPFVVWMLLFPLLISVDSYFSHSRAEDLSLNVKFLTSFMILFIWFFVGYLLFEPLYKPFRTREKED